MSLLKDLEAKLERAVEGAFAKGFKSGVQPVEIAKKLDREMESSRSVGVSKIYIPNEYTVHLNPADLAAMQDFSDRLIDELRAFLDKRRKEKGYSMLGVPAIMLMEDAAQPAGLVEVESRLVTPANQDNQEATASLTMLLGEEEGETFLLGEGRATIGRLASNDIAVPDPSLSRHHAEITGSDGRFVLADLGATNGTFLNKKRVAEAELKDGDKIGAGEVVFVFRRF
jgi:hypothetical protein